jgi:hypothetical protein
MKFRDFMDKNEDKLAGIHSKKATAFASHKKGSKEGWDVSRVLLYLSDAHKVDMESHGENVPAYMKSKKFVAKATQLANEFREGIKKGARQVGIKFGTVDAVEGIVSEIDGKGQDKHMDSLKCFWNATSHAPNPGNIPVPATILTHCPNGYVNYPKNMESIPVNWEELREFSVLWNPGDILFFKSNVPHRGPPNPGQHKRYVLFAAASSGPGDFSDSQVILNKNFNQLRNAPKL